MRLHNAVPDGLLFNANPTKGCIDVQVLPEDNGSFLFCKKRGVYIMKKALIAILALILVAQPALQPSQTAKAADVHRQMELALNEYPGLSTEQEETSLPAGQVETLPAVSHTASLTNLYPQDLTPPKPAVSRCGGPSERTSKSSSAPGTVPTVATASTRRLTGMLSKRWLASRRTPISLPSPSAQSELPRFGSRAA
jgi:hypothetical protein